MAGFGSIVGFMLSYFFLIAVFFSLFYMHQEEVVNQIEVNSVLFEDSKKDLRIDFTINQVYNFSNRIYINLENLGSENLFYTRNGEDSCFDVFFNSEYVNKESLLFGFYGGLNFRYDFIEPDSEGFLIINENLNIQETNTIRLISCEGVIRDFIFLNEDFNFYDTNYINRLSLNIVNPSLENLFEYQVQVDLNSSNINFNNLVLDDVSLISTYDNFLSAEFDFDIYQQDLVDSSFFNNNAYLGVSSLTTNQDPAVSNIESILFNSLYFSGNELVTIGSSNNLEFDEEVTISFWFNWDGTGDAIQTLFSNGDISNSINIINDGGVNDGRVVFDLNLTEGNFRVRTSQIQSGTWYFLTATYDSNSMKIYLNSNLEEQLNFSTYPLINSFSNNNYIGANQNQNFFSGYMDEFKLFFISLDQEDINNLYSNRLRYFDIPFYIYELDYNSEKFGLFAKIPFMFSTRNITLDIFYNSVVGEEIISSMEETFTYTRPRKVGFVLSDLISNLDGVSILNFFDNNSLRIGSNSLSLNSFDQNTLSSAQLSLGDEVFLKKLANIEGNGNGQEMISPISWAGNEFVISGTRGSQNRFCYIAPWGSAFVRVFENSVQAYNLTVDEFGSCFTQNLNQNANIRIVSDSPILVNYFDVSSPQDAVVLYPSTNRDLYGIPSNTLYLSSGSTGGSFLIHRSTGSDISQTIGANSVFSQTANGAKGSAPAFRIKSLALLGAIQQADSDGTESSVFAPSLEFSTIFGSTFDMQYAVFTAPYADANCRLLDSSNNLISSRNGTGSSSFVYKYDFGNVGSNSLFLNGPWKVSCEKAVWGYYEKNTPDRDETNLFGFSQMRQFIFPTPFFEIR